MKSLVEVDGCRMFLGSNGRLWNFSKWWWVVLGRCKIFLGSNGLFLVIVRFFRL